MKRTIALTRAREESDRSAARLMKRGFAAVIAPATSVHATGAEVPSAPFDAVVATSAKALEGMSASSRAAIAQLPLYVVGARTALVAAEAGFALAEAPKLDVTALIEGLRARLAPASRILYLAGHDRRGELEGALVEAGHGLWAIEMYEARARQAWSPDEARAVAVCDAVLHYSQRSAELALSLAARAGIADRFQSRLHVCLSREAAAPLRALEAPRLFWPSEPREEDMFDALESVLADYGSGLG